MNNLIPSKTDSKASSPGGGLRPLSLLQDRDPNIVASPVIASTRPLTIGKKQKKSRVVEPVGDENVNAGQPPKRKRLKSLKLVRSETSKMRGLLRKDEVLPHVVIRPPSTAGYDGGYAV